MIDKKHIGMQLPVYQAKAEAGQLRFFAQSIGETNPIYLDVSAARDAGHPDLPLPPTFLFSLEFQIPSSAWRDALGIETSRILHGEGSLCLPESNYITGQVVAVAGAPQ